MKACPLYSVNREIGTLTVEERGLYRLFTAEAPRDPSGIYRAFAVGGGRELPLGVMVPDGHFMRAQKTFSCAELGDFTERLTHAELRLSAQMDGGAPWRILTPEALPSGTEDELRGILKDRDGVLIKAETGAVRIAVPFTPGEEYPLAPYFCLTVTASVSGKEYALLRLSEDGIPLLPIENR